MEERIIDRERQIKLKKMGEETDAVEDDGREDAPAEEEEEICIEIPEGLGDEFAGLPPERLREKLEERRRAEEKARAEYERLVAEGERLLACEDYAAAQPMFEQAAIYEVDGGRVLPKLWIARTKNFTDAEPLYDVRVAEEFSRAEEDVRRPLLAAMGEGLRAEREKLSAEAEPLRAKYTAEQGERAVAFRANFRYYAVRFAAILAAFALCAIACGVSSSFLLRTRTDLPLIFTLVFAGCAAGVLAVLIVYARKLWCARELVRENEDAASTPDGARLAELDRRIRCISLILGA